MFGKENYLKRKEHFFLKMARTDGRLASPIDLWLNTATPLELLEDLEWTGLEEPPRRMKVVNSGKSVVVSGLWSTPGPSLAGGLLPDRYVLSQVHFHWGRTDAEGSEHTVDGASYPLEMHVMMYRACYKSQRLALTLPGGVLMVVYLARLEERSCPGLQWLSDHLKAVVQPHSSVELPPSPFSALLVPFSTDYLAYWGAMNGERCSHPLLWLVCRAPLAVSSKDLAVWRTLLDPRMRSMSRTFSATHPASGRRVFHVSPSADTSHILLPCTVDPPGQVKYFLRDLGPHGHCGDGSEDEINILQPTVSLSDTYLVCRTGKTIKKLQVRSRSNDRTSIASLSTSPPHGSPHGSPLVSTQKQRKRTENNVIAQISPTGPVMVYKQPKKPERKRKSEDVQKNDKLGGNLNGESSVKDKPKPPYPQNNVLAQIIPKETPPAQIVPKQKKPAHIVPKQTMPAQIVPKQKKPAQIVPKQTMPAQSLLKQTVPAQILCKQGMAEPIASKQINYEQATPVPASIFDQAHSEQRGERNVIATVIAKPKLQSRLPDWGSKKLKEPDSNIRSSVKLADRPRSGQPASSKVKTSSSPSPSPRSKVEDFQSRPDNVSQNRHWIRDDLCTTIPRPSKYQRPLSSSVWSARRSVPIRPQSSTLRSARRNSSKD